MCCNGSVSGCNGIEICNEDEPDDEKQPKSNENVCDNQRRSFRLNDLEPIEHTDNDYDEYQIGKHIVLLVILLCSMFVVSTTSLSVRIQKIV